LNCYKPAVRTSTLSRGRETDSKVWRQMSYLLFAKILYGSEINKLRDFLSWIICYEFGPCSKFPGFGSVFSRECFALAIRCRLKISPFVSSWPSLSEDEAALNFQP